MNPVKIENAVIIRSNTRLEDLKAKFNTVEQAKFYIKKSQENFYGKSQNSFTNDKKNSPKQSSNVQISQKEASNTNGNDFIEYEDEDKNFYNAFENVKKQISSLLKIKVVEQRYLPSNIFSENDLVIVLGRDGLVANTAKYVSNIPIIAINPDKKRYDGVLLPFESNNFMRAVNEVLSGNYKAQKVSMAEAVLNDGQRLLAFNELFIGVRSHSSARYQISFSGTTENHSSSGIIVSTGAGSTGWLSSIFNMTNGIISGFSSNPKLKPEKIPKDANYLVFVVREPFASVSSQAGIVAGKIQNGGELLIESLMPNDGIIFSDGIFSDFLNFNSGTIAKIGIAKEKAILVY